MNKELYQKKTKMIKALANPTRLLIVDLLATGEKNVSEIIELIGEEQSNVSKCLAVLKSNGIVKDRKDGMNVYYSLKICCMGEFFTCMNKMLEENSENQDSNLCTCKSMAQNKN